MYKLIGYLLFLSILVKANAQVQKTVKNPNANNGALIDAKEVGDPSLHNATNANAQSQGIELANLSSIKNNLSGFSMSGFLIGEIIPKTNYDNTIQINGFSSLKLVDIRPDKSKIG